MKRITEVSIDNFCVYDRAKFEFPNGCNLLIYGENGSGKSSLYKATQSFFESSVYPDLTFQKNRHLMSKDGDVSITFSDFDVAEGKIPFVSSGAIDEIYSFSSQYANSTNKVPYIRTAAVVKGFLDYTDLLKLYLSKDSNPNLFELIVLTLLKEHTPFSSGATKKIGENWKLINDGLHKTYTRNDRKHKLALKELPIFEIQLRSYLDEVFIELNRLLRAYFGDLHLELHYHLKPMLFSHDGWKSDWDLKSDLRLQVLKDGLITVDDYNQVLNEARLSAISVCLYLAALLKIPSATDCKILFFDDVFIGLDSGNRLPILNILKGEFADYQKIISTYDRQWFELAKQYFNIKEKGFWETIEMYSAVDSVSNIPKPIIVKGSLNIEKACRYLHHNISPDYPAAANYLRKAIEELIKCHIPPAEAVDSELIQIPAYKLTSLASKFSRFLSRIGENLDAINTIESLLHALLHPLSHHEIDSPIYKSELLLIERAYYTLNEQIKDKGFIANYKCKLEAGKLIRLNISTPTFIFSYEITLDENFLSYKSNILQPKCRMKRMSGTKNGKKQKGCVVKKDNTNYHYESLDDAKLRILNFLIDTEEGITNSPINYQLIFEYNDSKNWITLDGFLNI